MKTKFPHFIIALALLSLATANFGSARAQGTGFAYQGRLQNNGAAANGTYDMQFALFNTNATGVTLAGPVTNSFIVVSNGLFTTLIDFGNAFNGPGNWLELAVRTNGNAGFTTLYPRQQITPTPYAISAENLSGVLENNAMPVGVSQATISGGSGNAIQFGANDSTIGGGINNNVGTNSFIATIGGGANNSIGTNDDTSTIAGGNSNIIQDDAGVSTIAGGVGNQIQTGSPRSTISGGSDNHILGNAEHSTIAGGGGNQVENNASYSFIGGGQANQVQIDASGSVIAGGQGNLIGQNAYLSTIAGGNQNTIQTNDETSTIGGGNVNTIENNSGLATISGGGPNTIQSNSQAATIGGGQANRIGTNSLFATVNGGFENFAGGEGATVGGGVQNIASGQCSFAAGQQAQAINAGSFVWADSQNAAFSSTADNQFLIRAGNGVGINVNNPDGASLYVQGNRGGGTFSSAVGVFENISAATGSSGSGPALRVVCDGGSTPAGALSVSDNGTGPIAEFGNGLQFVASIENDGTIKSKGVTLTSDRNAKENFQPLDFTAVLAKVASLPVSKWNYKTDDKDVQHIGPMAQDFQAAFGLNGQDDKHISVIDEGGVALAAIRGLNQKLEAENSRLQQQNDSLALRLHKLEISVKSLAENK